MDQESEEVEIVSTNAELPNTLRDTSGESDPNSTTTPCQLVTSEECSTVVSSSASPDSDSEASLTQERRAQEQPPQSSPPSSLVESLRAVSPTQEKSGTGARSESTFSVSGANLSVQWNILCKESEQLSEKLTSFVTRLKRINGSRDTSQLMPPIGGTDETVAKEKEGTLTMLKEAIEEAAQTFQNFSSRFNEMDDKMKQWIPAAAAAQVINGECIIVKSCLIGISV